MAQKRYLSLLDELKRLFQDDQEAIDLADQLSQKVTDLEFEENTGSSGIEFPLPAELEQSSSAIAVFSDGACRGNPGPGAWGILGQNGQGEKIYEGSGVEMSTTNNIMEMSGAIEGLKRAKEFLDLGIGETVPLDIKIYLYSDSKYVVDGATKWLNSWKRRGWKKADNKPPENLDLWKSLDEVIETIPSLRFFWVKGHAGHPQNEYCDQLANKALDEAGL